MSGLACSRSISTAQNARAQFSYGDAMFEFDFEAGIEDPATQACLRELAEMPSVAKVRGRRAGPPECHASHDV